MTWQERALRAVEEGWLLEDRVLWRDRHTCPAAEIAGRYGIQWKAAWKRTEWGWRHLWKMGDALGKDSILLELLPAQEFFTQLEAMEDYALRLKREMGSERELAI